MAVYAMSLKEAKNSNGIVFKTNANSLEENGRSVSEAKKYLGYLVKHNIM